MFIRSGASSSDMQDTTTAPQFTSVFVVPHTDTRASQLEAGLLMSVDACSRGEGLQSVYEEGRG